MLKIDFSIPPETVKLENTRDLEAMALEDILYWCFQVRVNFVDALSGKSQLLLPDASLFDVLVGLAKARDEIISGTKSAVRIDDKEGGFIILIEPSSEVVRVSEQFRGNTFYVSIEEFLEATKVFIESALSEAELKFPKLVHNPNYEALVATLR